MDEGMHWLLHAARARWLRMLLLGAILVPVTGAADGALSSSAWDPASVALYGPPSRVPPALDAAVRLYAAWKSNDRATAREVADPAAVQNLFGEGWDSTMAPP